jgi:diguanylate cyclase (GGDEF)-like protein
MLGNLSRRVFRTLALTQLVVTVGIVVEVCTFHRIHDETTVQQDALHALHQALDSIPAQLDPDTPNSSDPLAGVQRPLLMAARQAEIASSMTAAVSANSQNPQARQLKTDLDALKGAVAEVATAVHQPHRNKAAEEATEQARIRLLAAVRQARNDTNGLDADLEERFQTAHRAIQAAEVLGIFDIFLIVAISVYVARLEKSVRKEAETRQLTEQELRCERRALEERVNKRTAELQDEVKERSRVERLNRGRNTVLEMVLRREPTEQILQVLVDTITGQRSIWTCALHLADGEKLKLTAHSRLPNSLERRLETIPAQTSDAPELLALRNNSVQSVPNLNQEHRPWIELLRANGAQSIWSAPFMVDDQPAGTMTIYTLLLSPPSEADIETLKIGCQMASLILERQRLHEELVHRAYHDALTDLGNRRLGEKGLNAAIERARSSHTGVAVLWVDLDRFKQINDRYGHPAGDHVLQQVARRLRSKVRSTDTLARMGGDEFMLILEGAKTRTAAERIATELLDVLSEPIRMDGLCLNVTASIGMSFFPEDGETAEELERNADSAMYEAKFEGAGVRIYTPMLNKEQSERQILEAGMVQALEHGGFRLVYQPQCSLKGEVTSFEALLRFEHPELGNVPPTRFIRQAEETGLILEIDRWVLREACRQLQEWQQAGYPLIPVAINISARQFARDDFSDKVAETLAAAGVAPSLLELELTERLVMKDFAESARQMQKLKELGVRIAVDDFGTGYSSLSYLHQLPIDVLKIDRSFIERIDQPDGTLPIVEAVALMAHALGLRIVGEGVETMTQLSALRTAGCEIVQGYLFARPLPVEEATLWLEQCRAPQEVLNALTGFAAPQGSTASLPDPALAS